MSNIEHLTEAPVASITRRQLGVRVGDGSVSMSSPAERAGAGSKASEVNLATRELLTRLKASRRRQNFSFAFVDFNDSVSHWTDATPIATIDDNGDFDPTSHGTGGTFVGAGLLKAEEIAERFLGQSSDVQSDVVLLVLTDGECSDPQRTEEIARKIKQNPKITIACAFFATLGQAASAGPDLLKRICTDASRHYKTVYNAEALRDFFLASMTAANPED